MAVVYLESLGLASLYSLDPLQLQQTDLESPVLPRVHPLPNRQLSLLSKTAHHPLLRYRGIARLLKPLHSAAIAWERGYWC
jgi:hypothetical protein